MLAPHISVVNLGCRVNRVESDRITADLMRLGFAMVEPQDADRSSLTPVLLRARPRPRPVRPFAMHWPIKMSPMWS